MQEPVETLRWRENERGGYLQMIDQTRLPTTFEYVNVDSAETVAHGIRTMVVRGAPAIGCAAAYGIALDRFGWSRAVLAEHGNMSSVTVLYVLADYLAAHPPGRGGHAVVSALGPGFSSEAFLMKL